MSNRRPSLWLRLPLLLAIGGTAHAQSIVPKQAQVCGPDHVVDKAMLATFLLDAAPVSRRLEDWATLNRAGFENLSPRQRMLVDQRICEPVQGELPGHCAATDAKNLSASRQVLISMLMYQPQSYQNVTGVSEPRQYFAVASSQLRCLRGTTGQPVEIAGAVGRKFELKVPVRVRGNSDGLYFARTDAQFKAQEKATISFANDFIKKKRTEKFAVVVGYPIAIIDTGRTTAEIVPYAGIARDVAKVDDTETVSADLWRFGTVLDYSLTANQVTHWLVARPEYQFNDKENSKLATMNLTYMPVINGRLNDYRYLVPGNDHFISFQPILDVRFVAGQFLKQGSRTDETSRDFLRLGGQAGISFSSDIIAFPADLTITEVYLPALTGSREDLSYLKAVLALGVDKDRLIGADISYVRGKRDDLLDKEKSWTIGFGVKF